MGRGRGDILNHPGGHDPGVGTIIITHFMWFALVHDLPSVGCRQRLERALSGGSIPSLVLNVGRAQKPCESRQKSCEAQLSNAGSVQASKSPL